MPKKNATRSSTYQGPFMAAAEVVAVVRRATQPSTMLYVESKKMHAASCGHSLVSIEIQSISSLLLISYIFIRYNTPQTLSSFERGPSRCESQTRLKGIASTSWDRAWCCGSSRHDKPMLQFQMFPSKHEKCLI